MDTDLWDIFGQQLRMPSEIQILKQLAHLKWANSSIVVRSHILSDDERSKQPQSKSQFVDRKKKNRNTQKKPVCDEKKNMAAIKSTIITNF